MLFFWSNGTISGWTELMVVCFTGLQEKSNASDCTTSEDPQVTHLTLRIEDASDDDVIFVGVLQESHAEVCEPESEKEKRD